MFRYVSFPGNDYLLLGAAGLLVLAVLAYLGRERAQSLAPGAPLRWTPGTAIPRSS